ncbi:hypothetical protein GCM10010244_45230 [Streptomyces coeruleorubidus]|nr:hypothetical protein GCM10010244_45230 [Streptomyces bellus]
MPVSCLRAPPQRRFTPLCCVPRRLAPMALRATLDPDRSSTGEKRAGGPGKWGAKGVAQQ